MWFFRAALAFEIVNELVSTLLWQFVLGAHLHRNSAFEISLTQFLD